MGSQDGLMQLLTESGIAGESNSAHRLLEYYALLEKWNSRINLTASTEWLDIKPLFLEGIWASQLYPPDALFHLDIGTGAGFPAVILGILVPRIHLEMVESRVKKGVFLETVVQALRMNQARVHQNRLDAFLRHGGDNTVWDCITWKGLKLRAKDLLRLRARTHPRTEFWMFHGGKPAMEEPEMIEANLRLLRNERFPFRNQWNLSIYLPR